MPGYAANLVRSGARSLTTRARSYSAAAVTMLKSTRAEQAAEASGVNAVETHPMVSARTRQPSSSLSSVPVAANAIASTSSLQSAVTPAALPPAQTIHTSHQSFSVPNQPSSGHHDSAQAPFSVSTAAVRHEAQKYDKIADATLSPASSPMMAAAPRVSTRENTDQQRQVGPSSRAATSSEHADTGISSSDPESPVPNSASYGAYRGRRIRVEHSNATPNPAAVFRKPDRASALSTSSTAAGAGELISPVPRAPGQPAGVLASRGVPRISAHTQTDASPAVIEKRPETAERSSIFSLRPALSAPLTAHESVFASTAAKRPPGRDERQPEGPRLSIGLLEVQIIQESSTAPQTRTQQQSPLHEQDNLERSYVRQIG